MVRLLLSRNLIRRLKRELRRFGVEFRERDVGLSYIEVEIPEEHLDLLREVLVHDALKEGRVKAFR